MYKKKKNWKLNNRKLLPYVAEQVSDTPRNADRKLPQLVAFRYVRSKTCFPIFCDNCTENAGQGVPRLRTHRTDTRTSVSGGRRSAGNLRPASTKWPKLCVDLYRAWRERITRIRVCRWYCALYTIVERARLKASKCLCRSSHKRASYLLISWCRVRNAWRPCVCRSLARCTSHGKWSIWTSVEFSAGNICLHCHTCCTCASANFRRAATGRCT